jgi:hypothetical protein
MDVPQGRRFCPRCGQYMDALSLQPQKAAPVSSPLEETFPLSDPLDSFRRRISLRRIVAMTALSYGLYLFYWAFITWKRYGQHTGTPAPAVLHALTLATPVYGWLRMAAHVRAYKALAERSGLAWRVAPARAAAALAAVTVLAWAPVALRADGASFTDAVAVAVLGVGLTTVTAVLLQGLQRDINALWSRVLGDRLLDVEVRAWEVTLGMAGLVLWGDTILSILSASYRAGV